FPYSGQGFNNNVHFAASGTGSSVATWTFTVTPGQYLVSATWSPHANRATNSPYSVLDGSTPLGTVPVNQQATPSDRTDSGVGWKALGTFNVTGTTLTVTLSNAANGYVIADGIRIEYKGGLPSGPTAQVFDGSTLVADGGSDSFGTAFVGMPV